MTVLRNVNNEKPSEQVSPPKVNKKPEAKRNNMPNVTYPSSITNPENEISHNITDSLLTAELKQFAEKSFTSQGGTTPRTYPNSSKSDLSYF